MEVTQIKLEAGLPSEVSVTMSIEEAVAIAKVFGMMNGYFMDEESDQGRQVVYVAVDAYELERGYFEPSSLVRLR